MHSVHRRIRTGERTDPSRTEGSSGFAVDLTSIVKRVYPLDPHANRTVLGQSATALHVGQCKGSLGQHMGQQCSPLISCFIHSTLP